MTNTTGKNLRKSQIESDFNLRRADENFVLPERTVNSLNKLHPYKTEFNLLNGKTAYLNLKIKEFPILCTVNPPSIDVRCTVKFDGDNPGVFTAPFTTTRNIDPPNDDYSFTAAGVKVPLDGCYSVLWQSPAYGAGYDGSKNVSVGILHNGYINRVVVQKTTGAIVILGPAIFVYTPVSPLYTVIECVAGDIIGAFMTENDISVGFPWVAGTVLHGFFRDTGESAATIEIALVAVAEG